MLGKTFLSSFSLDVPRITQMHLEGCPLNLRVCVCVGGVCCKPGSNHANVQPAYGQRHASRSGNSGWTEQHTEDGRRRRRHHQYLYRRMWW